MIDVDRIKGWLLGLIACAIITLLAGCRTTKYVPVENVRTEYRDKVVTVHDTVHDSVLRLNDMYRHDSVIVRARGDTVFVDRWHTLMQVTVDKGRTLHSNVVHDTIYINKADSARVPVPMERKLTKWQRYMMHLGEVAFGLIVLVLLAALVIFIRYEIKKHARSNI